MIIPKGNNVFDVVCDFCGQKVMSSISSQSTPMFRGGTECPDCLESIPAGIADAYIDAMIEAGKKRQSRELK